ncbi:MAG: transglycosylase SLT domain-containing protein [Thermodesulfobacteriota bacterium]|nr:transglycosylase SLT domain-containing protein [Thermodesulfobacteriota bacterium]
MNKKTHSKKVVLLFCLLISLFTFQIARGDIYLYIDENGVYHFTNIPSGNKKYTLFIKERDTSNNKFSKSDFSSLIKKFANKYMVNENLVKAIIKAESNFNSEAVSKKGAKGLMQLMPGKANELNVRNVFNPSQNIEGGVKHFKYLLDKYKGNLLVSLAAYNAGENAVNRYNGIPPFPETWEYVNKVLEYYDSYDKK